MIDKEEARARLITMAQNESLGLEREALIIGANALIDNENLWLEAHDKQIRAEVIEEFVDEILNFPIQNINSFDYVSVALILNKANELKEKNK